MIALIKWLAVCAVGFMNQAFNKKMNYDQINLTPIHPGYGIVYQGGHATEEIKNFPRPLAIINLNKNEDDNVYAEQDLYVAAHLDFDDCLTCSLPDDVLLGLILLCKHILASGTNLYIHCQEGISRSSYVDIALHMNALPATFDQAFKYVKARRPQIAPNPGFIMQLKRLQPILMEEVSNADWNRLRQA